MTPRSPRLTLFPYTTLFRSHTAELKKMLPLWKNIRIPVIYIQGEKDGMVYKTNASFAREHFINCPYLEINFIPGREHFITRSEEHTSELQSLTNLVCRLLLE